ncbi:MAG: LamG-like jellyroll fold domain-containing protein [Thermoguttaceae bacterium]
MAPLKWLARAALMIAAVAPWSSAAETPARLREPWKQPYQGQDATGKHVVALWTFDGQEPLKDASGNGLDLQLQGAELQPQGKFGGALLSRPGWPVADDPHCARCPDAPGLSPPGPFTIEMWFCPDAQLAGDYPEAFLLDKKYVADTDYQLILGAPSKDGSRTLRACLGFGTHSANWHSDPLKLETGKWIHLAFTYDAQGTGSFFCDGAPCGSVRNEGCGPTAPGSQPLTLGDRNGSYYHGTPGLLDQVRICRGVLEFRPLAMVRVSDRSCYVRMEQKAFQVFRITNLCGQPLPGARALIRLGGTEVEKPLPALEPGASFDLPYPVDTALRPGDYTLSVRLLAEQPEPIDTTEKVAVRIVPRALPRRMPVVMWGGIEQDLDLAGELGFTHGLGISTDYARIWEAGAPTASQEPEGLGRTRAALDEALSKGITLIAGLSPGAAMQSKPEFRRVGPDGKPGEQDDICASFPELQKYCENVGASLARSLGDHPAFGAALVHTEVRDGARPCFHQHDRDAYRKASGAEIPAEVASPRGVAYAKLPGFPQNRVIPDNHPILAYYRWYWKQGDGWNDLNSAVVRGLMTAGRADLWTFHDPAVRVARVYGSGGDVDFLSQWTYSYPDPIRIGLATDELMAMARGGPEGQQVMKMTQIIWYRNPTAPPPVAGKPAPPYRADWEREQPDAPFITIAPMQLREAFWTKIARPIKGIMYHGWQSLVPTGSTGGYRFTHPQTRYELKRLVETVVRPLGPTLLTVPGVESDVAFLESFASEMLAGRGTYGWCGGWAGDVYHALMYAKLQPEIVFDETVAARGLDGYRVLVMPDCDVLTESVARRIAEFQKSGGLIVGDERTCPAIKPDILLPLTSRTGRADADKAAIQKLAAELRTRLDSGYRRKVDTSSPDILPYLRRYRQTDYVFLVNDRREFGDYVGQHGLVMENGLPEQGHVTLARPGGYVYDLVRHCGVQTSPVSGALAFDVRLGPCDGTLMMVSDRPVDAVRLAGPASVARGSRASWVVEVVDPSGQPLAAVVPLELTIRDSAGRPAEFSGAYAAVDGRLELVLDIAANDSPGAWEIEAVELASGRRAAASMRVEGPQPWPPQPSENKDAANAVQPKG